MTHARTTPLRRAILGFFVLLLTACGPSTKQPAEPSASDVATTPTPDDDALESTQAPEIPNIPFAMAGGGPQRLFRAQAPGPRERPTVLRTFTTGGRIAASPIIGPDGSIYIGSTDGSFNALRRNGALRWSFICPEPCFATAAISQSGVVYVGCDDDAFRAFTSDGTLRFTYRMRHDADSPAAIAEDGTIYTGGDGLHALSSGGQRKWKLLTGGHVSAPPSIRHDDTIIVGSHDHRLYAASPSGTALFAFGTGGIIQGAAAILEGDDAVFGSSDGHVYRLLPAGGLRWKTALDASIDTGVSVSPDEQRLFVGTMRGEVVALHAEDGSVIWRTATGDSIRATPMLDSDGVLFVGSRDRHLYALDADSGTILWRLNLGSEIDTTVAITATRQLLVGADDGNLYFIGAPTP
ncbi:MAG: PQQ-binding-like beta-propeller repeat protein [Proteobacteria bacterium]|nr:PQQ-binding-like beta-propeller repeat protein [Pseudomonadota bacterium]